MSNLLEQAIVDATALREAAMKNAEAALIEKYSKEFKESVQKILEQEEPSVQDTNMAATEVAADSPSLDDAEKEKAFEKVAPSFLDGQDDELITINFDQLNKQIGDFLGASAASPILATPSLKPEIAPAMAESKKLEESWGEEETQEMEEELELEEVEEAYDTGLKQDVGKDALAAGEAEKELEEKIVVKVSPEQEEQQEWEFEESEFEELEEESKTAALTADVASKEAALANAKSALGKQQVVDAAESEKLATQRTNVEESIELTLEELQELEEALSVDIKVGKLSDGYMGTTETQKREQSNLEKAAVRDDAAKAKPKEEAQKIFDEKNKQYEPLRKAHHHVDEYLIDTKHLSEPQQPHLHHLHRQMNNECRL
jgi:hypothetical protein